MAEATQRIAVVSGSNKGIGLESVKQLASAGVKVVLTARDEKKGLQALKSLRELGFSEEFVIFHQLDVADAASVTSLSHFIKSQFGKLDILMSEAMDTGEADRDDSVTLEWGSIDGGGDNVEKFILVGKIIADKTLNRNAVRSMILKGWNCRGEVVIGEMGVNLFMFTFEKEEDMVRVLKGRPWSIIGFLLNIQSWASMLAFHEIGWSLSPYWVQFHGIPPEGLSGPNAERLGTKLGKVVAYEDPKVRGGIARGFMRVRVMLDIMKPFVTGVWVPRPNMSRIWIQAKYEKLQHLCFRCGMLGHDARVCRSRENKEDELEFQWGPGLGVSPCKALGRVVWLDGSGKIDPEPSSVSSKDDGKGSGMNDFSRAGTVSGERGDRKRNLVSEGPPNRVPHNEQSGWSVDSRNDSIGTGGLFGWDKGRDEQMEEVQQVASVEVDITEVVSESNSGPGLQRVDSQVSLNRAKEGETEGCIGPGMNSNQGGPALHISKAIWRNRDKGPKPVLAPGGYFVDLPSEEESSNDNLALVSVSNNLYEEDLVVELNKVLKRKLLTEDSPTKKKKSPIIPRKDAVFVEGSKKSPKKRQTRKGKRNLQGVVQKGASMEKLVDVPITLGNYKVKEGSNGVFVFGEEKSAEGLGGWPLTAPQSSSKPSLVFLMETKSKVLKVDRIRRNCFRDSEAFTLEPEGLSGGLSLWWRKDVKVEVLSSCRNFLHTRITLPQFDSTFTVTFVYGAPKSQDRQAVWDKIEALKPSDSSPWCCIGDFNEVGNQGEKLGGRPVKALDVFRFQNFVTNCCLIDMEFKGHPFTWSNKQHDGDHIKERLDRVMGNVSFRDGFPKAQVFHKEALGSDHAPIILILEFIDKKSPRRFRVESFWLDHPDFKKLVDEAWKLGILGRDSPLSCFMAGVASIVDKVISDVDNENLLKPVSSLEIRAAAFQLGGQKAPGPDGEEGRIHWQAWEKLTRSKEVGGLGFRDFSCFNLAMLAKQGWRIISNPNELWVRILKGIYFPKCSFLEAKKGAKASWAWSSLLEGRDLLVKNLTWRVGDGCSIDFWKDPWVPNLPNFRLPVEGGSASQGMVKVADFIVNGRWDAAKLRLVVESDVVEEIFALHIPRSGGVDKLCWAESKNGVYSVRSGYFVARSWIVEAPSLKPSSSFLVPPGLWKALWKVKAPPKMKNLLWRMCSGSLASKEALCKRRCAVDAYCPLCSKDRETLEHLFLFCDWVKRVWFCCRLGLVMEEQSPKRIEDWLFQALKEDSGLDERSKSFLVFLCWHIWKARCDFIFQGKPVNPVSVNSATEAAFCFFWSLEGTSGPGPSHSSEKVGVKWVPPCDGCFKINSDATFSNPGERSGVGVVIRDNMGVVVDGASLCTRAPSCFGAEALALLKGMEMAESLGLKDI
ncbi:reverse transcriptase [Senna tora]|uniref:Reverse transcriptase n=1 Tax=Senna tora TaxID=362788 RepID=A0A834T4W5_9FABA|nr:reverse transcriptase [Senna tora]